MGKKFINIVYGKADYRVDNDGVVYIRLQDAWGNYYYRSLPDPGMDILVKLLATIVSEQA